MQIPQQTLTALFQGLMAQMSALSPTDPEMRELLLFYNQLRSASSVTASDAPAGSNEALYAVLVEILGVVQQIRDRLTISFSFTITSGQTVFTLPTAPAAPQNSSLYLEGIKQLYGSEYTINGTQLTWLSDVVLEPGDNLVIFY